MKENELSWIGRTTSCGAAEPVSEKYIQAREMTDEWEAEMMYSDQGNYPSER